MGELSSSETARELFKDVQLAAVHCICRREAGAMYGLPYHPSHTCTSMTPPVPRSSASRNGASRVITPR